MTPEIRSLRSALLAVLLAVAGCGGDDTPDAPMTDAPIADAPLGDTPLDAGRDDAPPTITSSRPRSGAIEVAGTAAVELRFSEAIDPTTGSVSFRVGDTEVSVMAGTWSDEADVLSLSPDPRWPSGARIDARAEGFEDLSGNAMEAPFDLVFHVSDEGAPSVVSSSPSEGASDVALPLGSITVTFSEPMNPLLGRLVPSAGVVLGTSSWGTDTELEVEVLDVVAGSAAHLVLEGFQDVTGNALDGAPVLLDGALDFTVEADTTAPTLIDANPMDGQLDVDVAMLTQVSLRFSEPMDRSVRTVPFDDGSGSVDRIGNWSEDGLELTFEVEGALAVDTTHVLDLSALTDRAGNPLDGDVALTDGTLSFTTSAADAALPFVVFTTPIEGAIDVSNRSASIVVVFSEAMDVAIDDVVLTGGADVRTLPGTYNPGGTRLTLPLTTPLAPSTAYALDLSLVRDASGNALEPTHPYLGDVSLDFTTGVPSGEDCADPLTAAEASVDGTALVWELPGGAFVTPDGLPSCSVSSLVDSGVIELVKTTADLAGGGRALRITASSPDVYNGVQLEIRDAVCDPDDDGTASPRLACLGARQVWTQYLDVPAGTYYLWVSNENGGEPFQGATIRVEEIDAIPEGESCGAPFTASSAIHTSPAAGTHVWRVPFGAGTSSDYGTSTRGEGTLTCTSSHGPDAVIRVDKTSATSVLDVSIDPFPTGTLFTELHGVYVEARSACEGGDVAGVLECTSRITRLRDFQLTGPVGPEFLWLASSTSEAEMPRVEITVREIEPAPGDTCATAIPIATGSSVAVTPSSPRRFFAPSCVDGDVTWYRYTATRELGLVRATGSAPLALVDPSDGEEFNCLDDGSQFAVPRRTTVGTDVCIAIPSGSPITALTVEELDWQGVVGTATDLMIARPLDGTGNPISITNESFIEVTPSQIYLGINTSSASTTTSLPALIVAPRTGMENATRVPVDRYAFGLGAVSIGEALFSVEETARPNRLFRIVDSAGAPNASGTVWDTGSLYTGAFIRTMTRIAGENTFLLASVGSATLPTVFYSGSTTTPGALLRPGDNALLRDAVGLAANANWVFVLGNVPDGDTTRRTVYRIPRADLTAVPEPLAPTSEFSVSSSNGALVYDAGDDILYFRTSNTPSAVHAIWGASTATPVWAGPVVSLGRSVDQGLALDPAIPALFLFETATSTDGAFAEIR